MNIGLLHPPRILAQLHSVQCHGPGDCSCAPIFVVHGSPAGEQAISDNGVSVEQRGISTTRAQSHRLSEPRSDLLIPGLAGVSSFEESAE